MTVLNVEPSPSPEPSPTPSPLPDEKGLWGHIADVADFLFATKSLGRLFTGQGSWGDAAAVGITAASFFIPPIKLLKFGVKPLESIIVHAAEVAASDTASVAAKNAAELTANNARYLLENPTKHEELLHTINNADNPEALKLHYLPTQADHFLETGTVPLRGSAAVAVEKSNRIDGVLQGSSENWGKKYPMTDELKANLKLHKEAEQQGSGVSRSLFEEGAIDNAPNSPKPDTFLQDVSSTMSEMRIGTRYPKYPHLDQEFVDELRVKGFTEKNIKDVNTRAGKLDDPELAGGINDTETRRLLFKNKEEYDKFLNEPGQDINLKGEKLDWAVQHKPSIDENGDLVLTELENGAKEKPLTLAERLDIVPRPKRLNDAARVYPSEAQADLAREASNLLQAKMFGTPEDIARYKRSYLGAQEDLKKALNSSKITPHAAMAIRKQQQKDLVDKIFKSVIPEFKPKNPYARSASKRLKPTSEVDPRITQDVAKKVKVTVFDRITHVENILKREQIDFLPESKQYQKLIKSNYDLNNPKELAEYNDIIKNYKDELVNLKELQVKHVESVQSFVKDLDDNGIKYFVRILNGKPLKELESLDHHVYINLLRDIFRQAKADDVKRSVATLGKRFKSLQDDALKQQNKLEMEKRLSRNAPLVKNNTSLDRNEETLAKVQAMAKPEPKEPEVVAETLSKEERLAATKAKVEALAKTKPAEVVEKKTVGDTGDVVRWKSLTSAEQKDVVYIGRGSGDKGKFGNPFPVGNGVTVKEAVDKYRSWLWDKIKSDPEYAKELYALKGKRLACPGSEPNDACHGQVILKAIEYLDKHPELMSKSATKGSSWSRAADDEILVFGSNLEGRHGKGAALEAREKFGAKQGQARGRQGQSYAIPTKDLKVNKGLPLSSIKKDIDEFLDYAEAHPDERFFFSALGTGLAGHSPKDIAGLISRTPSNVRFDPKIGDLIGRETKKATSNIVVHSGLAAGADTAWAKAADESGIKTIGHSFKGHSGSGTRPSLEVRNELTESQLKEADVHLKKANEVLNRPTGNMSEFVRNLLRRNYYQIKDSEAVLAVSKILPGGKVVDGGTGWAVQMGIDMGKPVYVFDQEVNAWAKWNGERFVKSDLPPKFKSFAGIGSRNLKPSGRQAIKDYIESLVKGK